MFLSHIWFWSLLLYKISLNKQTKLKKKHVNDNHITFEVSLNFLGIWATWTWCGQAYICGLGAILSWVCQKSIHKDSSILKVTYLKINLIFIKMNKITPNIDVLEIQIQQFRGNNYFCLTFYLVIYENVDYFTTNFKI